MPALSVLADWVKLTSFVIVVGAGSTACGFGALFELFDDFLDDLVEVLAGAGVGPGVVVVVVLADWTAASETGGRDDVASSALARGAAKTAAATSAVSQAMTRETLVSNFGKACIGLPPP
jgi:hypothetical protein